MIIPVTNPLDPMVYVANKVSGFDRNRIFGMGGMLDLSRFIQFIHEATGHSRSSIRALSYWRTWRKYATINKILISFRNSITITFIKRQT